MNYGLEQLIEALEALYAVGVEEIEIEQFIFIFCRKFDREEEKERARIKRMLRVVAKARKEQIRIKDGKIWMWNVFGGTQHATITTTIR